MVLSKSELTPQSVAMKDSWWVHLLVCFPPVWYLLFPWFRSMACLCHFSLFCCSVANSCLTLATPRTAARQAFLSFTVSRSLLELISIESVMHPTISSSVIPFSSCPQSFPASGSFPMSRLFTSGGQSSFSFSISPSNEYSGLISFRID